MKNQYATLALLMLFSIHASLYAQESGEDLFKATCVTCHTIGGGRLIGPDLSGVNDKREQEWLFRFIRSSQKLIKENDPVAVELFKEYSGIPMPDNDLNDAEIISILDYIKETGLGTSDVTEESVAKPDLDTTKKTATVTFSADMLKKGKALFYGHESFANGAPSCIACHNIQDESIIGGGKLSFDLTGSYGRLGEAGVLAILKNPPFPAMNVALQNKNLTDEEMEAVTAMLHFVNERYADDPSRSAGGVIYAIISLVIALFLLIHIYILYDNRKVPS
ncbi:c-type cytochrome [Mariniphaga sediminis]|jgi:mono/diheme cytochrome c family protein|uniref:c-type cytochrome n=1 Tax=Mariniphaga sediminis TaxID=1628158 RepID=UPI0035655B23